MSNNDNNFNNFNNDISNNSNNENLCIICWEFNGKIILCLNCKFKYCDNCVKKIDGKCCICFRKKKNNNFPQYYGNFYSDDFEITYNPNFYTSCLSVISCLIIFTCSCVSVIFLFVISLCNLFQFLNPYFIKLLS